jgi:hypothetical protein
MVKFKSQVEGCTRRASASAHWTGTGPSNSNSNIPNPQSKSRNLNLNLSSWILFKNRTGTGTGTRDNAVCTLHINEKEEGGSVNVKRKAQGHVPVCTVEAQGAGR